MNHDMVVRQKMTERYLLDELDPAQRDEFEEHLFDCQNCADDVRAGAIFVEKSKVVLAESPAAALVPAPAPASPPPGWFAWLRPAFAMPALAVLLAVVGYQNLVTYPQLEQALNRPQVLPFASVNVGTWGAGGPVITTAPGKGFLLFVRIPPDSAYARYTADLYNPAGKLEWSLTIPAIASQDQWPVQVPGANRESGTYTMAVRGVTAAGESKEVGRASFDLQIQK
ncbi:MAG: zf-HC2 domain-containing protein [Acidobacteriia bacterium]|nr:zf-HC2 domain-containing protein [Terriglobia bacterium]